MIYFHCQISLLCMMHDCKCYCKITIRLLSYLFIFWESHPQKLYVQ
jgi:hypothetical protein